LFSKKKCVQNTLSNKPNAEKLEESIEEQSPLKDTNKSLIHNNKISESEPTKTNDHSIKDTVQDETQM